MRSQIHQRCDTGLTVTECLVVVTIVTILALVLFPALSAAHRKGIQTADLAALHQIALAGVMYDSSYGAFPISIGQLADSRIAARSIDVLAEDGSSNGIGNEVYHHYWGKWLDSEDHPTIRHSLLTYWTFHFDLDHVNQIKQQPASGWAVDRSLAPLPTVSGNYG